jgi:hypothetical protein
MKVEKKVVKEVIKDLDKELLEAYKKQNPVKYATKLANGEFGKK